MKNRKIIIGSRGSELALWQANDTLEKLKQLGHFAEVKVIKTQGDRITDRSFEKMEGKGFFTRELEEALLTGVIDLAVHSHKDLPTEPVDGLETAAVSQRAPANDLLIIRPGKVDISQKFSLVNSARVGTSSPRRKCQLKSFREDLRFNDIRGNVPTRLEKLRSGKVDAIVLAQAGVDRLGLSLVDFHVVKLSFSEMVPAPAQGVLAYQIRSNDEWLQSVFSQINSQETKATIEIERSILNRLDGGCHAPIGVHCQHTEEGWRVNTAFSEDWEKTPVRITLQSEHADELIEHSTALCKNPVSRSIFISRNLSDRSILTKTLRAYGYQVYGDSMVNFEGINITTIPDCDWIFFSSKNGVRFFFEQNPVLPMDVKFAAIGAATCEAILQHHQVPSFRGEGASIGKIAATFAKKARGKRVLFPQAVNSMRSIQKKVMDHLEVIDLKVYNNAPTPIFTVPHCEVLVFTSPMKVELYFEKYDFHPTQTIVAIGNSTAKKLTESRFSNVVIPEEPGELFLLNEIMALKKDKGKN